MDSAPGINLELSISLELAAALVLSVDSRHLLCTEHRHLSHCRGTERERESGYRPGPRLRVQFLLKPQLERFQLSFERVDVMAVRVDRGGILLIDRREAVHVIL